MRTHRAVMLGLMLLVAGCGKSGTNSSNPNTPSDPNTIAIIAGSGGAYDDPSKGGTNGSGFAPGTLSVAAGTTVTWANNDSVDHQPAADNGVFNGAVGPGQQFHFTFANAGTFTYH